MKKKNLAFSDEKFCYTQFGLTGVSMSSDKDDPAHLACTVAEEQEWSSFYTHIQMMRTLARLETIQNVEENICSRID